MFKKSQFGIVFNTVFSLVFSAALTLFIKAVQGNLSFNSFCMGMVPAFGINFTLGSYIPLVKVGNAFASRFVKDENSKVFYFLRMLAIVFIMTALMSFLLMFSEMGFRRELIFAFLGSVPMTFLFAYVVGCAVFPLLFGLTVNLCSKEG